MSARQRTREKHPQLFATGLRVRMARMERGMTQAALGLRLTPTRSANAISSIETGATILTVDLIEQLAVVLGKSAAYFYEGGNPAAPLYHLELCRIKARVARQYNLLHEWLAAARRPYPAVETAMDELEVAVRMLNALIKKMEQ